MENYIVSARKYRPAGFDAVVGQESITRTLKNAISTGKLAHAFLFCGPHGVGKTTCARIFAKTINCLNLSDNAEACNKCESCIAFNEGRSFSIHELDAASNNSVEDIRSLNDQVRIPPQIGKYSLYIIDEVHMLSAGAFNAFLKTLEEPPDHGIFILATTEKHKIIPTILSRCQIYDFNRIGVDQIVKHLEYVSNSENVIAESEALNIIAQKADGSMRDALSIFDQILSFSGAKLTYEIVITNLNFLDYNYYFRITTALLNNDYADALIILREIINNGFNIQNFISGLSAHFRDLLVCKTPSTTELLEVGPGIKEKYIKQSKECPEGFLLEALEINNNCNLFYKASLNKNLHVELNLIKLSEILGTEANNIKLVSNDFKKKHSNEVNEPVLKQEKNHSDESKLQTHISANQSSEETANKKVINNSISQTKTISIKDAINGNQVADENTDGTVISESNPIIVDEKLKELKNDFGQDELMKTWTLFAEGLKNDEPRLYNTLISHMPVLKNNYQVEIQLNNPLQEKAIKLKWNELLIHLKNSLQNSSISLTTVIAKNDKNDRLYTDEEKFEFLKKNNPDISGLRKKLGLDFE